MSVSWNLILDDPTFTYLIDLAVTGAGNVQCIISFPQFVNADTPYSETEAEALVNVVNTTMASWGTTSANTISGIFYAGYPSIYGGTVSVNAVLEMSDWSACVAEWTPVGSDAIVDVFFFIRTNNQLSDDQVSTILTNLTAAIHDLPSLPGVVTFVTGETPPSSLISDPSLTAYYTSVCSANYTSTTAGDLAGTSISVVVTKPNSTITATGVFDMQSGTATGACAGIFNWNGTDQAGRAGVGGPVGTRSTAQQTWIVTGVSPGTYTAKLRGSVNTGGTIRSTNTTLTVSVS